MPAATNTSPSPASAEAVLPGPRPRKPSASSATPAPRKRRDAAPRSRYVGPRRPRFLACYSWLDMAETLKTPFSRWILACAALLGAVVLSVGASAQQMNPGPPPPQGGVAANPVCPRLEAQLATIDRGGGSGDPAKEEQIRRYQEAASKQQGELDRVTTQAKRMGCDSSGFFSLFNNQSAQCGPVNNQIQQMRGNLDQITTSLERLRAAASAAPSAKTSAARCWRRWPRTIAGRNTPMPRAAAADPAVFWTICSATTTVPARPAAISVRSPEPTGPSASAPATAPISRFPSPPSRPGSRMMNEAARRFARRRKPPCSPIAIPARTSTRRSRSPAALFRAAQCVQVPHRIQSVLRLQGGRTDLVRRTEDHRRQGRPPKQGDIIVTEESAKKMARPPAPKAAPVKKGAAPAGTTATAPAAPEPPAAPADATGAAKDKPIRSVGPTFIPTNPPPAR